MDDTLQQDDLSDEADEEIEKGNVPVNQYNQSYNQSNQ
jgi:hypothetical protein